MNLQQLRDQSQIRIHFEQIWNGMGVTSAALICLFLLAHDMDPRPISRSIIKFILKPTLRPPLTTLLLTGVGGVVANGIKVWQARQEYQYALEATLFVPPQHMSKSVQRDLRNVRQQRTAQINAYWCQYRGARDNEALRCRAAHLYCLMTLEAKNSLIRQWIAASRVPNQSVDRCRGFLEERAKEKEIVRETADALCQSVNWNSHPGVIAKTVVTVVEMLRRVGGDRQRFLQFVERSGVRSRLDTVNGEQILRLMPNWNRKVLCDALQTFPRFESKLNREAQILHAIRTPLVEGVGSEVFWQNFFRVEFQTRPAEMIQRLGLPWLATEEVELALGDAPFESDTKVPVATYEALMIGLNVQEVEQKNYDLRLEVVVDAYRLAHLLGDRLEQINDVSNQEVANLLTTLGYKIDTHRSGSALRLLRGINNSGTSSSSSL